MLSETPDPVDGHAFGSHPSMIGLLIDCSKECIIQMKKDAKALSDVVVPVQVVFKLLFLSANGMLTHDKYEEILNIVDVFQYTKLKLVFT